jgi:hypothetical protein
MTPEEAGAELARLFSGPHGDRHGLDPVPVCSWRTNRNASGTAKAFLVSELTARCRSVPGDRVSCCVRSVMMRYQDVTVLPEVSGRHTGPTPRGLSSAPPPLHLDDRGTLGQETLPVLGGVLPEQ